MEFLQGLVDIYNKSRLGEMKVKEELAKKYESTELICCELLK